MSEASHAEILLVEDNPQDLELTQRAFRREMSPIASMSRGMERKHSTFFLRRRLRYAQDR